MCVTASRTSPTGPSPGLDNPVSGHKWYWAAIAVLVVLGMACAPSASAPATQAPVATSATAAEPTVARAPASTLAPTQPAQAKPTAAAATATAPAKPTTSVSLKAAYAQASTVQGVIYVAREKAFFSRHGLDVELSQVGGVQQVAALVSGDIQFAGMGANEVANADLRGSDLVMIATCSDLPIFSLYTDNKYTSVPELAGQAIGVTSAGSSTDAAAHLFLRYFDMLDKVKVVPAGGTQQSILAALQQGNIAGGIFSPPTHIRAEEAGYVELVNGRKLGVPMNHSGIVVTRAYMKDNLETVKNYLAAYAEAWTYSADPANKAEVVAVLAQYAQSDERLAELGYQAIFPIWAANRTPRVNPEGVANLLQVSGVPEAEKADPEVFFDNSLIDSIAPPG
jgi:NitT/TauT family transport system substrate-binding protein